MLVLALWLFLRKNCIILFWTKYFYQPFELYTNKNGLEGEVKLNQL